MVITSSWGTVLAATPYKAPDDDDPPRLRWQDYTFHEGTNTFQIAIKDASTITGMSISYTRYDPIFEEYDTYSVALTPVKNVVNMYQANIVVYYPETEITVFVVDAWGHDDSESETYDVGPSDLVIETSLSNLIIPNGEVPEITIKNNHAFGITAKVDVAFSGFPSGSNYATSLSEKISGQKSKDVRIPIDPKDEDKNRPATMTIKVTSFGITKEFTFQGVTFQGTRTPEQNSGGGSGTNLHGRYERVVTNQFEVTTNVARMVVILQHGDTLTTPGGINLIQEVYGVSPNNDNVGKWIDHIYIAQDTETPIELKAYQTASGRFFFIIDVPELGLHSANSNFIGLLRYYS